MRFIAPQDKMVDISPVCAPGTNTPGKSKVNYLENLRRATTFRRIFFWFHFSKWRELNKNVQFLNNTWNLMVMRQEAESATDYLLTAGEQHAVRTALFWPAGRMPLCEAVLHVMGSVLKRHVLNTYQPGPTKVPRMAVKRNPRLWGGCSPSDHTLPAPSCRRVRADCTLDRQVDSY